MKRSGCESVRKRLDTASFPHRMDALFNNKHSSRMTKDGTRWN